MALSFPSEGLSANKPRVRFISQTWEIGKPDLSSTKGAILSAGAYDIQLYLPGGFREGYGATWGEEDLVSALVAGKGQSGVSASAWEALDKITKSNYGGIAASAKYGLGETSFPGKFLLFSEADTITLDFNFEMVPRNVADATTIETIVRTFKTKILPTYSGGLLKFPDVWNVQFIGIKGLGFPDTPGVYAGMALVAAVPSYGSSGGSTLTYKSGHPVSTSLQLTFKSIRKPFLES